MLKSIGLSIGAFFSDPFKFVGDPANTIIEYQTKKMVAEGKTADQIEEEMKEVGMLKGAGPVKVVIDTVAATLELLLRYLPLILLGLVLVIALNYAKAFKVVK